ncbi:biopolymer transporter ExbD [Halobacteriovorax sp.]|uniref:biopolymer transporter ExbD n=1 Tax=Halobacteriovorax sp. TaxID=2020862 RepID=UPI003567E88F
MATRNKRRSVIVKKKKELDIDITSLLDILVILLVFLLKSYNPSDLKLDLTNNLELPESVSLLHGNQSVTIQVNKNRSVYIDNKEIGKIPKTGSNIAFLEKKLKEMKEQGDKELKEFKSRDLTSVDKDLIKSKERSNKQINIVLDQTLSYSDMQKVMHASATAGFPKFKFIVKGGN